MPMASLDSQWTLMCLLLFLTAVASVTGVRDMNIDEYINYINPPAVHKFLNKHGDSILCVAFSDQISLQKGSEQRPVKFIHDLKMKSELNFSSYGVQTICPEGTVAIMETKREHVERWGSVAHFISKKKDIARTSKYLTHYGAQNEYAVAQFRTKEFKGIAGVQGGLSLWQPYVDTAHNGLSSLAQISVMNEGKILETMDVGWIVDPKTYGDSLTRLFVYWTVDGYTNTGCWNTHCPGFVLAPNAPTYPGAPLAPLSTYNGLPLMINVKIINESPTEYGTRWAVYLNNDKLLGWWPASLFKNLHWKANRVDFGGGVTFSPTPRGTKFTKTQMGSGHFPPEGLARAANIWDIQMTDIAGAPVHIPGQTLAGKPQCYDVAIVNDTQTGMHVFFGGPGGGSHSCVA